ncbi:urease accessory protein [Saccharopolyspora kobensis]|uniref:Urease accessory protein UreD n=1 Tax=Saccharopolyspora kobensis TaxID=146035 RepID=A0A1H6D797_9PSEU|nr:urease accessory protein UreD [Saccharopolyspora kobensis]SEG80898.1 urease accessory protein [Saccharopolyspora kobensis]SFD13601.1 urease accessory protein [Saccharopolyspora kobensis]
MRASALLSVELGRGGRSVVRELRSQAPMTMVPRRAAATSTDGTAVVHLVGSAATPVGGDLVDLRVHVGPGARLLLRGTAATVALPGQHAGRSRSTVHIEVAEGGTVEYLPEATVITARAVHEAEMTISLGEGARARCRETLVLGRYGERSGLLTTTTHVVRGGTPLLRQRLDIGDERLTASAGYLAGARVLATETVVWNSDPVTPSSGQWWSLAPLAAGGALATAVGDDAVVAERRLAEAVSHHPDAKELEVRSW